MQNVVVWGLSYTKKKMTQNVMLEPTTVVVYVQVSATILQIKLNVWSKSGYVRQV